jgi:aryl-alcohol dehydrogenase-like predicted oxidoreductase
VGLILGTWSFSGDSYGPIHHDTLWGVLDKYYQGGGRILETSNSYGLNCEAEDFIAEYLTCYSSSDLKVITKIGNLPHTGLTMPQCWEKNFLLNEAARAHRKFGENLSGIMLHSPPADLAVLDEALHSLSRFSSCYGLEFGVALKSTSHLATEGIIEIFSNYNISLLSVNFSLMDQRLFEVLDRLYQLRKKANTQVFARTVLNFGFLANPDLFIYSNDDHRSSWSREQIERWRTGGRLFSEVAASRGLSLIELAIAFAGSFDFIDDLCIGFVSKEELAEALRIIEDRSLDPETLSECRSLYKSNEFFIR